MGSDYFEILSFIKLIRESFDGSVEVYTNGSCFRFALILSKQFPGGKILLKNGDHAVYEKGGHCFDITGEVEVKNHVEIFETYSYNKVFEFFNLKYMSTQPTHDPLGIHELQGRMNIAIQLLEKLEQFMLHGKELPVSEAMIIEKTGISQSTLLTLRQGGKIRYYKPAKKTIVYLPSEFTEDIKTL